MKRPVLLGVIVLLCACDSKTDPPEIKGPSVNIPTQKEIQKEVSSNVKDVLDKKGPKWSATYSGDLSGSVSGDILTAMGATSASIVAVGMGMTKDMKHTKKEGIRAIIIKNGKVPIAQTTLALADRTQCYQTNVHKWSSVKIIDEDPETFHAELAGTLLCGDKTITYKATLNTKP